MASCLWHGLSRSSEPTHMHLMHWKKQTNNQNTKNFKSWIFPNIQITNGTLLTTEWTGCNLMRSQLTLHAVIFLVVEAEVVSQLPAHHQLLDEGGDGQTCALPTALNLQRHPLSRHMAWREEEEMKRRWKEAEKDGQSELAWATFKANQFCRFHGHSLWTQLGIFRQI